jgi:hypothetical protein
MYNISEHFTYQEGVKSDTSIKNGYDNTPNETQLSNMKFVATEVFEPLRKHFNKPIGITSFFRCKKLNDKVGGSNTSQHRTGEAIDIDADVFGDITNKEIFDYIKDNLVFDQLIWEFGSQDEPEWVHVSKSKIKNKKQVLISKIINKKTVYQNFG